jgi:hypothetical protein
MSMCGKHKKTHSSAVPWNGQKHECAYVYLNDYSSDCRVAHEVHKPTFSIIPVLAAIVYWGIYSYFDGETPSKSNGATLGANRDQPRGGCEPFPAGDRLCGISRSGPSMFEKEHPLTDSGLKA